MKKRYVYLLLAIIFILISGCSPADSGNTEPALPTETATRAAVITPSPTPVPTTTSEPTPSPTPSPTPKPTPEEKGKEEIADGFYYYELNDEIKERITGTSYPEDDKDHQVQYDDLRYIRLKYYDFDGNVHDDGELIVNKQVAKEVTEIFYELYKNEYKLASVKLVDNYGQPGQDTLSMEANNTSAYCYRRVNNSTNMSIHSFGGAIDINPQMNPYIDGKNFSPKNSEDYLNRSQHLEGMIDHKDLAYKLFKDHGWDWGGDWPDPDYQHFAKKLGYSKKKP